MEIWKRNLYIIWICQFLAQAGLSSVVPFLPLFIRDLGISQFNETVKWSGYIFSAPFMISFFTTPIWGSLGDKYGRKVMTVRAVFGLAVSQVLIGFSQDVYQLFIFRILQGLLSGFYPASIALIATNTPKEKTGYALGILLSATTSGTIVGPVLGGLLSDLFGFRFAFIIVGSMIFIMSFVVVFFVNEEKTKQVEKESYSFIDNWLFLFRSKVLLITGILIFLSALGIAFIRPIFVLFIESFRIDKKLLPTITGFLLSIFGIFSAISAATLGKKIDKEDISKKLALASVCVAIMYFVHIFIFDIYLLIPVNIMLGFFYGVIVPLLFTHISKNSVQERKSGLIGIAISFQILGNMIGPIISGYIVSAVGLRYSFLVTGIIFLIIGMITIIKLKRI